MQNRISKSRAIKLINQSEGKIFGATFTKKDGKKRNINARLGVTKGVKGGIPRKYRNVAGLGYITVYDLKAKGFRTINTQTLSELRINKTIYTVR